MDQEQEKRIEKFGSFVDDTFINITPEMREAILSIARFADTNMERPEDTPEVIEQKKLNKQIAEANMRLLSIKRKLGISETQK